MQVLVGRWLSQDPWAAIGPSGRDSCRLGCGDSHFRITNPQDHNQAVFRVGLCVLWGLGTWNLGRGIDDPLSISRGPRDKARALRESSDSSHEPEITRLHLRISFLWGPGPYRSTWPAWRGGRAGGGRKRTVEGSLKQFLGIEIPIEGDGGCRRRTLKAPPVRDWCSQDAQLPSTGLFCGAETPRQEVLRRCYRALTIRQSARGSSWSDGMPAPNLET